LKVGLNKILYVDDGEISERSVLESWWEVQINQSTLWFHPWDVGDEPNRCNGYCK